MLHWRLLVKFLSSLMTVLVIILCIIMAIFGERTSFSFSSFMYSCLVGLALGGLFLFLPRAIFPLGIDDPVYWWFQRLIHKKSKEDHKLLAFLNSTDVTNQIVGYQLCAGLQGKYGVDVVRTLLEDEVMCLEYGVAMHHYHLFRDIDFYHSPLITNANIQEISKNITKAYHLQSLCIERIEIPNSLKFPNSIRRLEVTDQDFSQGVPASILHLKNLNHLCIENCHLTHFNTFLKGKHLLPKLNSLYLPRNGLTNEFLQDLLSNPTLAANLQHLSIADNPGITHLPAALFKMKSLTSLNIQGCSIQEIPSEITQLRKLNTLYFLQSSHVRIKLPDELSTLSKLTFIDFNVAHNDEKRLDASPQIIHFLGTDIPLRIRKHYLKKSRFKLLNILKEFLSYQFQTTP